LEAWRNIISAIRVSTVMLYHFYPLMILQQVGMM